MRPLVRALFAATLAGAAACGPLLGLDDLFERPRDAAGESGTDAADGAPPSEGGVESGPGSCTTNVQCKPPNGAPALCVSGRCVTVADYCLPEVLPNNKALEHDDVALFAAFLPLEGSAPLSQAPALAYALAIEELSAVGIPYNLNGGPRMRPLALVLCPSEPNRIEDSVKHVTGDLRVAGMIASFDNATFTKLVQNYAKEAGTFTLNPSTTTEVLRNQNDPLVFSLLGVPEDIAVAYRPLLVGVETFLREKKGLVERLRVALVNTDSSTEKSLRNVLESGAWDPSQDGGVDTHKALYFNSKYLSEMDAADKENVLSIEMSALENTPGQPPDYDEIATLLKSFHPHVIIALTVEEIGEIVPRVESGDEGIAPIWILGPRNASYVAPYIALNAAERQARFVGVQYAGEADIEQPNHNAWLKRMNTRYGGKTTVDYSATENFYDAIYWLAYGAAYPDGPLTGEAIGAGVRKLLKGTEIYPGSTDRIGNAYLTLSTGPGTYVGALGRLDIDPYRKTVRSVGGVYCYATESDVITTKYDVLRYDRDKAKLELQSSKNCTLPYTF